MAEKISLLFLRFKGYKILAHRFRTPVGEIDIVAMKKNLLVAVEVKARSTHSNALEALTGRQCQRIEHALKWFLARNARLAGHMIRFDLMLVSPWRLCHIKNAWWAAID